MCPNRSPAAPPNLTRSVPGEGNETPATPEERPDNPARVQHHGIGQSQGGFWRDPPGSAEEPVGARRMDRSLERALLGMGRTVPEGQGTVERARVQRWGVLDVLRRLRQAFHAAGPGARRSR